MWVVVEMDGDKVGKVFGPFQTHREAREYMTKHGHHGAFEVRPLENHIEDDD